MISQDRENMCMCVSPVIQFVLLFESSVNGAWFAYLVSLLILSLFCFFYSILLKISRISAIFLFFMTFGLFSYYSKKKIIRLRSSFVEWLLFIKKCRSLMR